MPRAAFFTIKRRRAMASSAQPLERLTVEDAALAEQHLSALFEWAAKTQPQDIPDNAWQRAAEILLDDISAMTGAWNEPELRRLYPLVMAQNHGHESSVFCQPGVKADRTTAALVNAISANWLELDEGYRKTPCHAGLYTLPALLSLAEADDISTQELLRNLIVGYELITRIARAFPQRAVVMQAHGRYAALGAACATALHRKSSAEQLARVASAAVTLVTPSPRNHLAGGALVRNIWAGVGARNGMDAANWAEAGIIGMPSSIHHVYTTIFGGHCHAEELTRGLGGDWAVTEGYTKMYACCQHLHAAVEAIQGVRKAVLDKGLADVSGIHVETHDLALPLDQSRPQTSLAAKFSMSHAMATVLVTGEATEGAFSSGVINDGRIDLLRQQVSMAPWPGKVPAAPNDRPARVHIRFKDGTAVVGECLSARGGSDRPYPKADLLAKIERLAGSAYPGMPAVAAALTSGLAVDAQQSWRQVLAAMRGPAGKNNQ
jgi:2-methylcitrate dehydratase PrpD